MHEGLQIKVINNRATPVTKRRIAATALVLCTVLPCGSAWTAETFKKLSGAQIKAKCAEKQFTELLIAATAVVGLTAYPILQPTWVMVH